MKTALGRARDRWPFFFSRPPGSGSFLPRVLPSHSRRRGPSPLPIETHHSATATIPMPRRHDAPLILRSRRVLPALLLLAPFGNLEAKPVEYTLTIARETIEIGGGARPAMTINGGIPGPVLRFREGDEAVIRVTNHLSEDSSIHWHGILIPPEMDGVPFISFPPIKPGETFIYRFPVRQSGTFWYHSHSGLQEQLGVYGPIVIEPKGGDTGADREHVVMLSDWTNEPPHAVLQKLRRGSEYYGVKKRSAQSLLGALKTGKGGPWLRREAMRMPAMDIADVAYDAFLLNGAEAEELEARPGETIRLRVIDGSATSFFHLQFAGGPLTIIAADGQAVEPVIQKEPLLIGIAETYDVLVTVPESGGRYEFRATAHDASGHASLWIGSGERHAAPAMPAPFVYDTMDMFSWRNLLALTPAGSMGMPDPMVEAGMFDEPGMPMPGMAPGNHDGMEMDGGARNDHKAMMRMEGGMDMKMGEAGLFHPKPKWYDFLLTEDASHAAALATDSAMSEERPFSPYAKLRATRATAFPASAPRREVRLTLDGDMERFVWFLNDKPLRPENDIRIRRGEVVRFIMINRTMMHHPMHLHGHFFRVLNDAGAYSPLKHTVDVEPMSTTVIEFEAEEFGDWFFHCHVLYHMEAGMARVVRYDGYEPSAEVAALAERRYRQMVHLFGRTDLLSQMTQGEVMLSNLRNDLAVKWEAGWQQTDGFAWEGDATYRRYLNRFTGVFAGAYLEGVGAEVEDERAIAGLTYLLPGNFHSRSWIDHEGEVRVTLEREIMLTPRLGIFGETEYDTREGWSYQGGASWMLGPHASVTALWDSDYGAGGGLSLRF